MVIDFHTHIFPEKIAERTINKLAMNGGIEGYTNGTQESLRSSMEKAGISLSVNLPVQTKIEQFESINNFAESLNLLRDNYKNKIISFGTIHPDMKNKSELIKGLKERGFLGIKIHPDYQDTFIDDDKYYEILSAAKDNDLITVIHAGLDVGYPEPIHCTPKMALSVMKRVGGGKIVLAHMGGFFMWSDVIQYLLGVDCFFDMGVVFGNIKKEICEKIVKEHGADRILFGTDSPWCDQSYALNIFDTYNFDDGEKELILHKNAEKLLKME